MKVLYVIATPFLFVAGVLGIALVLIIAGTVGLEALTGEYR